MTSKWRIFPHNFKAQYICYQNIYVLDVCSEGTLRSKFWRSDRLTIISEQSFIGEVSQYWFLKWGWSSVGKVSKDSLSRVVFRWKGLRTPPMKDLSYMGNNFKISELFHLLCLYKPHFGCLSLRDLFNVRLLSKGCL
jgi:hypothetical protein